MALRDKCIFRLKDRRIQNNLEVCNHVLKEEFLSAEASELKKNNSEINTIYKSEEEHVNQVANSSENVIVEVNIGDKMLNVQLDTEAYRSVISKTLYEKEFRNYKVVNYCKQFSVLNGAKIDSVGYINAPVQCSDGNARNTKYT